MAYEFTVLSPDGEPAIVQLTKTSDALPAGWALITYDETKPERCVLWMIHVRERERRKGYGRALIAYLMDSFDEIVTHYEVGIVNAAGTKLCLACGFVMKPSLFKKQASELVWRKPEEPKDG